eukprot:768519_1
MIILSDNKEDIVPRFVFWKKKSGSLRPEPLNFKIYDIIFIGCIKYNVNGNYHGLCRGNIVMNGQKGDYDKANGGLYDRDKIWFNQVNQAHAMIHAMHLVFDRFVD